MSTKGAFSVSDVGMWLTILHGSRTLVQCPDMVKRIIDDPPPDVYVVLIRRPLVEIHSSERRINWDVQWNAFELAEFGLTDGDSATAKYRYWDSHEKRFPFQEIAYSSLAGHPMWVAGEDRRNFSPKQTRSDPSPTG